MKVTFARCKILSWQAFFSFLKYSIVAFWPAWFLLRNLLTILFGISCTWWVAFLLLLSKFFLCLAFDCLIIMCLGVGLLDLSSLEIMSFLNLWSFVFPQILEVFSYSLNNLCTRFSSGTPIMCILILSMVYHKFLKFYSFFFILFLHRLSNFKWPAFELTDSSSYLCQLLNPSSKYFNSVIVFSALEFLFGTFLYFFFVDIFILFIYHFSDFLSSLGFPSAWAHLRHLL